MGRHARRAVRSRSTATAVGTAASVVLIVAGTCWWAVDGSGRPDPTATGSAVVVSSLACRNGDAGTVVDLLDPVGGTRRAIMDSCGHEPGEVLAVDYTGADPGRVVPAPAGADGDSSGRVLPPALVLAALLGVAAVLAVVRDGRGGNRAGTDGPNPPPQSRRHGGRHALPDEDEPPPVPVERVVAPLPPPSGLDLLFPAHDSLAASLHDELFTHRSPAGV